MPLDLRTAPERDLLRAYMLTFGQDWAKPVLEDLRAALAVIERDRMDKTGRMDPLKLAVADGARQILKRIETMQTMESTQEWQAIDNHRQMLAAHQKQKEHGNG
jgi:hypothetical protein